eukprot:TRINITY_DN29686_c0_g2_i1.p1 TRINITY_DN29686_c0_g2~~TRINITY_DN29686_c0_g2_i1.p1  ORF type:complete len:241 (-),score=63.34 TRINITY_DN29686_c0_g2_i1:141-863(-)
MMRRPPRSTLSSSSAASDVYKRQARLKDREQQLGHEVEHRQLVADTAEFERLMALEDPALDLRERLKNIWSDTSLRAGVLKRARDDWEVAWANHWVNEIDQLMPGGKVDSNKLSGMTKTRDEIEDFYKHHIKTPVAVFVENNKLKLAIMKIGRGEIKQEMSDFEQKKSRIKYSKMIKNGMKAVLESGASHQDLNQALDSVLSQNWQDSEVPPPLQDAIKEAARLTAVSYTHLTLPTKRIV